MQSNWIVDGDTTDHGGTVIVPECMIDIDGKNVASVGDNVHCPKCNVMAYIVEGNPKATVNGVDIAEVGCRTSCGARLVSIKQTRVSFDEGLGCAAGAVVMADLVAEKSGDDICEACLDEAAARGVGLVSRN
jgi:uncharacterized Zn-binding protein involved in type VI secretion